MKCCQLLIEINCYLKMLPIRVGSRIVFFLKKATLSQNYFLFYVKERYLVIGNKSLFIRNLLRKGQN